MANQQNSTQGSYKSKTPRLFLRNLFTAGWENRDVLWPTTVQTPDGKTKPYVPKYPDTISGSFKAYRGQSKVLLKASLYFLIFIAPLLVLMLYGLSELMNAALASSYNFMGNIGIGYPGAIDSLVLAKAAKLNVYKEFMLYFYAGAVIASIGMAGLGNVARKAIWNEPFKYIAKPFFTGIKKHWWKYLLTVVVGGGIALAMAEVLLYHMVNMTLGVAGAGSWCAVIFTFVFGVPLALIAFTMLTMIPSYKLSFWQIIKNSIVMLVNNIVSVLMVVIISCVPIFLLAVSSMLSIFIYILMIAFGCSLVAMLWTGLGHSSYLKCAVLAEYLDENDKKKNATDARERKYAEKKEIRGEVVEKKPQQKQQFQNPKKKKKQ